RFVSLLDMLFGSKLTNILVCQRYKRVSQTYGDIQNLSLSIKPEDYAKEKKQDRFEE
ncbi:hypothetical protein GYMLUDRAFT_115209, partial [Collybiopsis luxurians FD-317 M1]